MTLHDATIVVVVVAVINVVVVAHLVVAHPMIFRCDQCEAPEGYH